MGGELRPISLLPASNLHSSVVPTALWPVLISNPTEGRKVNWHGWRITYRYGLRAGRWSRLPVLIGACVELLR